MSKGHQKEVRLEIRLSFRDFPRSLYVNRFRVERDDRNEFSIVHFGLLAPSGLLLDHYSCVLSKEALGFNQVSLVGYLSKIGQPKTKAEKWQPPASGQRADVVDIVSMAYRDEIAETVFSMFSMVAGHRTKPSAAEEPAIDAHPVVLLRSSSELQKQLLVALYEEG